MLIELNPVKAPDAAKDALDLIFLDFETFYDGEYSLKKISPPQYILDPRFEALGMSYAVNSGPPLWVDGPDLPALFRSWRGRRAVGISHNALFDFSVLRWRYGWLPEVIGDTIGMARAHLSHRTKSLSLASLAHLVGLQPKGSTIEKLRGIGYAAMRMSPDLYEETKEYCNHDCELCRDLYWFMLATGFPEDQLELIDMQVRMAVQPSFVLDQTLAAEYLQGVIANKQQLLFSAGLSSRDDLMSDAKLAALLINNGLREDQVPMKESRATGKLTYAFAKTDRAFTDLENSENEMVAALVSARLASKTTIEETRSQRFLAIAQMDWLDERPSSMPIALKWAGAHTGRLSGDWSMNAQNLKRGGKLRYALTAPKGYKVVSSDASQIEARMTATMAGQWDLVAGFERGEDVYASFASELFKKPVNKNDNPLERFVGKTGILSLGYGSWWQTFQNMCRVQSEGKVLLSDSEAEDVVRFYRKKMDRIKECWLDLNEVIEVVTNGGRQWHFGPPDDEETRRLRLEAAAADAGKSQLEQFLEAAWKPKGGVGRVRRRTVLVEHERVLLPGSEPGTWGNTLNYSEIMSANREMQGEDGRTWVKTQWVYRYSERNKLLYGAKTLENIIQALAFIQIMEAGRRIKHRSLNEWGYALMPVHQVHDELIYVVPNEFDEITLKLACEEISRKPWWMPEAPLAAEGGIGQSYGEAKEG